MTKEEAKELIKEKEKLEIKINRLRNLKPSDMKFFEVFDTLEQLRYLYCQHRQLSEKIKMVERLAPRE